MAEPESLQPVDESWSSALAIVAHPDDLEYGTASAIARWTAQGKSVTYCMVTSGEAGIDGIAPEKAGPLREQEERDSAELVGVPDVEFLHLPDGTVEYGLALRRDIARVIRVHRPEVLITANHHDSWGPGSRNQADHIAVGQAVIDGARDAANRWIFRDLVDEGLDPWHARTALVGGSPLATHAVDVSDHLDAGIASLRAHAQYLAGLGDHPMSVPEEFLPRIAEGAGKRLGCRYAVAFEVIGL